MTRAWPPPSSATWPAPSTARRAGGARASPRPRWVRHPRVAPSLLGHLAGAINGAAVARGTSFLKDRLGQRVLPAGLTVGDDPTRRRGPRPPPPDAARPKGG